MTTKRHPGSLLKRLDLDKSHLLTQITLAAELRVAKGAGTERPRVAGKNFALIFEKNSTRTPLRIRGRRTGAPTAASGPTSRPCVVGADRECDIGPLFVIAVDEQDRGATPHRSSLQVVAAVTDVERPLRQEVRREM